MRFIVVSYLYFFLLFVLMIVYRSDPDKDTQGWGENDRGVSFTFGADVVAKVRNSSFPIQFTLASIIVLESTRYGFNMSSTSSI